jgi:hypothetical protein
VNFWLWFRMIAILVVVIASCFTPVTPRFEPPISWLILLGIFAFVPIAVALVIGFQRLNPRSAMVWTRPSWSINPFNFRDLVQFFYLGALLSMTQGIIYAIRVLLAATPYPEAFVALVMGVGVWLGVKLVMLLNPAKFSKSA